MSLLLVMLAVWSITDIIHNSSLFEPVRNNILSNPRSPKLLVEFILCWYCKAFWASVFCCLLYYFNCGWLLYPFAFHTVAMLLHCVVEQLRKED